MSDSQHHQTHKARTNEGVTARKFQGKSASKNQNKSPEVHNKTKKTTVLLGDSITKNLIGGKMSRTRKVISKSFSGSTVEDMRHYIKPTLEEKPDEIILHIGTNNIKAQEPNDIARGITSLAEEILMVSSNTKVAISSVLIRNNDIFNTKIQQVNGILSTICTDKKWSFIEHSDIDKSCLNQSGLHLNKKGQSLLAKKFISHFRSAN